jgi:hypothetical protein
MAEIGEVRVVLLGAQRELETLASEMDRLTRGTSDAQLADSFGTLQDVHASLQEVCRDLALAQERQEQAESYE